MDAAAAAPPTLPLSSPSQPTLPLPAMLPSGKPVSARLQGEGEPRAVAAAAPGTAPTPEQRAAIADLHEPSGHAPAGRCMNGQLAVHPSEACQARTDAQSLNACDAGGSSPLGPNAGTPGTSILSADYGGTTKGTIAGGLVLTGGGEGCAASGCGAALGAELAGTSAHPILALSRTQAPAQA